MTGVMGEILEHYGQTVTLRSRDGEKSVRAFIQPAAARDETVPGEQTPIGWIDERLWRYTGLEEVQPGDTVIWRGRSFRVRSSREHALSDEINHWWALLEPRCHQRLHRDVPIAVAGRKAPGQILSLGRRPLAQLRLGGIGGLLGQCAAQGVGGYPGGNIAHARPTDLSIHPGTQRHRQQNGHAHISSTLMGAAL